MTEFRGNHPILYCVLAAALGLGAMMLVDWLWGLGVSSGALAGVDAAVPELGTCLVKLIPFALGLVLLRATGRLGLLTRTDGFGRGLASGAFLLVFSLLVVGMGVSRLAEGEGAVPSLGAVVAFMISYLLVGLGEETLGRAVLAQTLLEHFGLERRGILAACGLSGLIFGLMHLINLAFSPAPAVIAQVVSATFAGVLLAAIYFRGGNIWATVLLHALYDMSGSVSSLLQTSSASASTPAPVDAGTAQVLALVMPMAFGVIIGCVALFLLRKSKVGQVREAWAGVIEAPEAAGDEGVA